MLGFVKAAAFTFLTAATFALVGCQDQTSPSRSAISPAAGTYNQPAGLPDNSGGGAAGIAQPGTGQQQVGTQAHSANLGGGTAHDPNANTPSGG